MLTRQIHPAPSPSSHAICMTGVTRLSDFIDFVNERTIGGRERDKGVLADAWRHSARVFEKMQTTEAGFADAPHVKPLSAALQAHVKKLAKIAYFQNAFSLVPVAFGMVELDKLIVYQQYVLSSVVQGMTDRLKGPLSDAELAALCLPLTPGDASFKVTQQTDGRFAFVSDSHDVRFQGAQLVKPSDVKGLKVNGHSQAVVALSFGFTTNILNVVRYQKRLVLNNGYHRAFALRQMGITHAPCLIQVCEHWEDVGLVGSDEISDNGTIFFSSARPPLLKDFANPDLIQTFPTKPASKEIRLSYEVDTARLQL